jgi:two-component system sensor histidine kinase PilS (NtrC family)
MLDGGAPRPTLPRLLDQHPRLLAALRDWHEGEGAQQCDVDRPHRLRAQFHRISTALGPRALIVLLDLTAEDERVRRDKLAALGRLIASIAHEVRNPLSSIRQAADLLPESTEAEERRQLTAIITQQSERINRLVEDVLGAARAPTVHPQRLDLSEWLPSFLATRRERLKRSAGDTTIELAELPGPAPVRVDTTHLWQVMDNLCDNAERHARPTHGELRVGLRLERDEAGDWHIDVCDNGSPIDAADRDTLFEPFFTTHSQGTGLGLFVSRELALANRGELTLLVADDSQGNCFRLTLPGVDDEPTPSRE